MAEVNELSDAEKAFLQPYLPSATKDLHDLPFVTLTYAQSMDSMISLGPGLRTTLSGPETKSMTHYLRLHHDAILIGATTAEADAPGLNSRYPGAKLERQPRPVIVDPRRRWDVSSSKVLQLAKDGLGKGPWILSLPSTANAEGDIKIAGGQNLAIQPAAGIVSPSNDSNTRFDWLHILKQLKQNGINSVMVEGGATVISTLLSTPELVDSVIVTIAPTWLGDGGVLVAPAGKQARGERVNAARLQDTVWRQFGGDAVLCGQLQQNS